MKKPISKARALEQVQEFFKDISNRSSKEIKKIKRLAMRHSIPLKGKRKLFCKKCYSVYRKPKVRVKNKIKSVVCGECGGVSRWRL